MWFFFSPSSRNSTVSLKICYNQRIRALEMSFAYTGRFFPALPLLERTCFEILAPSSAILPVPDLL